MKNSKTTLWVALPLMALAAYGSGGQAKGGKQVAAHEFAPAQQPLPGTRLFPVQIR